MKLGVIAAMKIEAEIIIAKMTDKKTESLGGIEYTTGKIGDCTVICSVCGIGKVFAGMCAQGMIIGFSPDYIINTGVAGTLDSSLSIGDIAVSSAVVQHDMDTSGIGDPPGLISGINMIEMPASEFLGSLIALFLPLVPNQGAENRPVEQLFDIDAFLVHLKVRATHLLSFLSIIGIFFQLPLATKHTLSLVFCID